VDISNEGCVVGEGNRERMSGYAVNNGGKFYCEDMFVRI
jgi:hypothetical protein